MIDDDLPPHVQATTIAVNQFVVDLARARADRILRDGSGFRRERVCLTCGGPLKGFERYCSLRCWRYRK